MAMRVSDLALERDASGRFLPWVMAVMVFMAALASAMALVLGGVIEDWRGSVQGRLTVQVAEMPERPLGPRMAEAARLLRAVPGIAGADIMPREAVEVLVMPWIGAENITPDLPLPGLIDVRIAPGAAIDHQALAARLEAAVPGARLDDPRPWLERLVDLARLVQMVGAGIVGLIGGATAVIVIFAVRAGIAAHRDAIELMHIMGAHDGYVARQFVRHVFRLALRGALPGFLAAAGVVYLLMAATSRLELALLHAPAIDLRSWAALAALPVAGIAVAALTARLTVLDELRRMT